MKAPLWDSPAPPLAVGASHSFAHRRPAPAARAGRPCARSDSSLGNGRIDRVRRIGRINRLRGIRIHGIHRIVGTQDIVESHVSLLPEAATAQLREIRWKKEY